MAAKLHVSIDERRARVSRRHRLVPAERTADPVAVARSLVALHGTDPGTVHVSAAVRMVEPNVAAVERALYEDRTLLRLLGMRRTIFVLPIDTAAIVQASCAPAIAVQQRGLLYQLIEREGFAADAAAWVADVEAATLAALARRGEATAVELADDEPRLREQVVLAPGKPYESSQSISTRILLVLALEGRIVRARPRGSWTSGQFRWATTDGWLPGGLPPWSIDEARSELARRWLAAFGPATVADLRWWTGWQAREVKAALARLPIADVDLGGEPGIALADDLEPTAAAEPAAVLLPALDPTVMGWNRREWYLGEHAPRLFDRNGNAGPTVWWGGRVIGGWHQRKDGEVRFHVLEDVGAEAVRAVGEAAARLQAWLGPVRLTARVRRPSAVEQELSA